MTFHNLYKASGFTEVSLRESYLQELTTQGYASRVKR